jgi:pimeloyl-ACP methyl ester carboxylesterase
MNPPKSSNLLPPFEHHLLDHMANLRLRLHGFVPVTVDTPLGQMSALRAKGGGNLPTVVMLHGVSSRGTHYRTVAPALLPHVREVLLPDFLAHGRSGAPAAYNTRTLIDGMESALDQLLSGPAVFYGNSLGGYAAVKLAARRPEWVSGLFLTSPAGGPMPDPVRARVIGQFHLTDRASTYRLMDRAFARSWPRFLRPVVARVIEGQLKREPIQRLLSAIIPEDDITPEELERLRAPVQVIWGKDDGILAPEQREWYRRNLPAQAVFEEPPGWGHSAYLEQAAELRRRLLAFLRDV